MILIGLTWIMNKIILKPITVTWNTPYCDCPTLVMFLLHSVRGLFSESNKIETIASSKSTVMNIS